MKKIYCVIMIIICCVFTVKANLSGVKQTIFKQLYDDSESTSRSINVAEISNTLLDTYYNFIDKDAIEAHKTAMENKPQHAYGGRMREPFGEGISDVSYVSGVSLVILEKEKPNRQPTGSAQSTSSTTTGVKIDWNQKAQEFLKLLDSDPSPLQHSKDFDKGEHPREYKLNDNLNELLKELRYHFIEDSISTAIGDKISDLKKQAAIGSKPTSSFPPFTQPSTQPQPFTPEIIEKMSEKERMRKLESIIDNEIISKIASFNNLCDHPAKSAFTSANDLFNVENWPLKNTYDTASKALTSNDTLFEQFSTLRGQLYIKNMTEIDNYYDQKIDAKKVELFKQKIAGLIRLEDLTLQHLQKKQFAKDQWDKKYWELTTEAKEKVCAQYDPTEKPNPSDIELQIGKLVFKNYVEFLKQAINDATKLDDFTRIDQIMDKNLYDRAEKNLGFRFSGTLMIFYKNLKDELARIIKEKKQQLGIK